MHRGVTAMAAATPREPPGCRSQPTPPSKRRFSLDFSSLSHCCLLSVPCGKCPPAVSSCLQKLLLALHRVRGCEVDWWPQHLGRAQRQAVTPDQLARGTLASFENMTPWQGPSIIKKHLKSLTGKEEGEWSLQGIMPSKT